MHIIIRRFVILLPIVALLSSACTGASAEVHPSVVSYAPNVPAPAARHHPTVVHVDLTTTVKDIALDTGVLYKAWTFNDRVPGPFIRAREGDTLESRSLTTTRTGCRTISTSMPSAAPAAARW